MSSRTPVKTRFALAPLTLCWLVALGAPGVASAATLTPLPRSDYAVRSACQAPSQGHAGCLALNLEPRTSAARSRVHTLATTTRPRTGLTSAAECGEDYPSSCLTPQDLRSAYFPTEPPEAPAGEPQTIALVDAYNDPAAEGDLGSYSTEFGLPSCTKANGCFKQMGESGGESSSSLPFPKTKAELETYAKGTTKQRMEAEEAEGWSLEIATDIEVAHAICHNCHILLVEAKSPEYPNLEAAENTAVLNATEVSNSWGGNEPPTDSSAFNHPGVTVTAATGDHGYLNWNEYATRTQESSPYFEGADYPASSPHVIGVGGTSLHLSAGGAWQSESAWSDGGSGCSELFDAPPWQRAVSDWAQVECGERRANADISADADPSTGVNVYDSTPYPYEEGGKKLRTVLRWVPIGGTSVASPIIASMFALAGGAHGVEYPAQTLYSHLHSALLHDITSGGDGECDGGYLSCSGSMSPLSPLDCGAGVWICNATIGYDGPTGVGSPNGIGAFKITEVPTEGEEEGKKGGETVEEQTKPGSGGSGGKGSEGSESKSGEGGNTEGLSGGGSKEAGNPGATGSGQGGGSTETPSGPPATSSSLPAPAHGLTARISALALTPTARAALRHGRLGFSDVAFSFKLSTATTVRVTLAVRVGTAKHRRWRAVPTSLTFTAVRGLNRRRLPVHRALAAGLYRLTLTPHASTARSITIRVP